MVEGGLYVLKPMEGIEVPVLEMVVMMSGRVSPRWSPAGSMLDSEEEEKRPVRAVVPRLLGSPSLPALPLYTAHSVLRRLPRGMLMLPKYSRR